MQGAWAGGGAGRGGEGEINAKAMNEVDAGRDRATPASFGHAHDAPLTRFSPCSPRGPDRSGHALGGHLWPDREKSRKLRGLGVASERVQRQTRPTVRETLRDLLVSKETY